MNYLKKYLKYKSKYLSLGGARPSVLTNDGSLAVASWLSGSREHQTDFAPEHFDACFVTILNRLRDTPKTHHLDIIFVSTGVCPYPEILTIERLIGEGYLIGNIYFIDHLYEHPKNKQIISNICSTSLIDSHHVTIVRNLQEFTDSHSGDPIDILIGFNFQLASFGRTLDEMTKQQEMRLNFCVKLIEKNPALKSFSFLSSPIELRITENIIQRLIIKMQKRSEKA